MTHPITYTQNETYAKAFFGFWLYILTDCVMFAAIFITYVVLRDSTYGGPSGKDLFHLPNALAESILLLTSSLFAGLARVEALRNERNRTMGQFTIAFVLGAAFLVLTYSESSSIISQGYSWQTSAFLSAFFTVIWTHAFHVVAGLIWIVVILGQLWGKGINPITFRRLSCLTLFWQFLAVIWVFTFTIVYLMGVAGL